MIEAFLAMTNKPKKLMSWILIIFSIHGLVGFAMFICEEACQTAMFAAFSYKTAEDWHGLERHIAVLETAQATAKTVTYSIGWLAPLMFPAYVSYLQTNEAFIDSQRSLVKNKT